MTTTTYDYKVRDRQGKLLSGKIEADGLPQVAGALREMGYLPLEIKAQSAFRRDISIPGLTDRVDLKEVAIFSRQLSTMVASGLTLVRSLSVLIDQTESKPLRAAITMARSDLEQGSSFSAALAKHPKIFSKIYISMVRAGEAGGSLDTTLLKLSAMIEKQVELRSKIRSAMTYPAVVVCVVVGIITAMMIVVVPTFKRLYSSLNGSLPVPTRIVIAISNTLASLWILLIIAVIVAFVVGLRRWIASSNGRRIWDRFKLRWPVFGPLLHKIALSRGTGTLASLLSSGVGLIEALDITAEVVGNDIVAEALRSTEDGVREGRSLASTLADFPIIPKMVTQMIETGEEAGALDDMLERVTAFYDNEIAATVASLTALLEPVIIVFMGLCIGGIVISLYLPMFDYVKLLTPH